MVRSPSLYTFLRSAERTVKFLLWNVGGDHIIAQCNKILAEEYLELADMTVMLQDKKTHSVGQSVAAVNLPELR